MMEHEYQRYQMAEKAIVSACNKSKKAITKVSEESYQYRLLKQGIHAYEIAIILIHRTIGVDDVMEERLSHTSQEALRADVDFYASSIRKVEAILPKFPIGTAQHTLSIRRIDAFQLAIALLQDYLKQSSYIETI